MYQIISDIKLLDRFDLTIDTDFDITVSGYQGSWVTIEGTTGYAKLTTEVTGGTALSWPVWTEENRDGTQGFTPDTTETGKITVVAGSHRAITDRYDHASAPTVGALLVASAGTDASAVTRNGQLLVLADNYATNQIVKAVCIVAPYSYTPVHGGTARNCIQIQVL